MKARVLQICGERRFWMEEQHVPGKLASMKTREEARVAGVGGEDKKVAGT